MSAARPLALALLLLASSGCFGDWVSAVSSPKREQLPAKPATQEPPPPPAEPCAAYLAEVARRCDAVFDGYLGPARCHGQVVRVRSIFHPGDESVDHRPRSPDRTQACTQQLRALPAWQLPEREPPQLGPSCRAWAELLRERCVAPLSAMPPALDRCGAGLLAYESTLGGITFGRPEQYEPQCKREVDRLHEPAAPPSGPGG